MARRRALSLAPALALALPACILEAEPCGQGFVSKKGRCIAAEPFEAGAPGEADFEVVADFGPAPDAELPPPEDAVILPDATEDTPWTEMMSVLVVDRTPDGLLGESPATPGCDLDGVTVMGEGLLEHGVKILASEIFDPFGQSITVDEQASLHEPEQTGEPGTFVSLGGGGGYQLLHLDLPRPLRPGDRVLVAEYLEPRDFGDLCAVFLCARPEVDLAFCRFLGEGRGGAFALE